MTFGRWPRVVPVPVWHVADVAPDDEGRKRRWRHDGAWSDCWMCVQADWHDYWGRLERIRLAAEDASVRESMWFIVPEPLRWF